MVRNDYLLTIEKLELSLLNSSVRQSVETLNQLIAEDFIEYGSSGNIYNKGDLLKLLPVEKLKPYVVEDLSVLELAEHVMLVTYQVTIESQRSLRSSVWKFNGDCWQMVFHQGTNIGIMKEK